MKAVLTILLLTLACSTPAPAMTIYLFAKMRNPDQATYIDNMVEGASKILKGEGHPDQAQKILDLFGDSSPAGGVNQFVLSLKATDAENRKNAINPNNRRTVLQVEDAMELMLKDHDIIIPAKTLAALNQNFMPAAPKLQDIQKIREDNQ
jgi:hypothetical protein